MITYTFFFSMLRFSTKGICGKKTPSEEGELAASFRSSRKSWYGDGGNNLLS